MSIFVFFLPPPMTMDVVLATPLSTAGKQFVKIMSSSGIKINTGSS
jgi:hypothetical protein